MKGRKRVVVGDEVLKDDRNGVDDQETDDLQDTQQIKQAIYQRTQLNPCQVQHIRIIPVPKNMILHRWCSSGGPRDLLDEIILQFFYLLPLDDSLQDVVLLKYQPTICSLAFAHSLLHLVELLIEGQLSLGVETVV